MKSLKPIYLTAANHISLQEPLSSNWTKEPIMYDSKYNEAIEANYKQWLSPGEARRLGKIMKRAVATSAQTMQQAGISNPDAIITATGLGCVKNTELFLTDLCMEGESLLKPTQFMQSTHNTIGSLIAILNKCHGYNVTYANGDISTETALMDAMIQLGLGYITSSLVGAHDEMTPNYYSLLERIGYYGVDGMVSSGETAVAMMLSTQRGNNALCRIADVTVIHRPSESEIERHLQSLGGVTHVIAGYNGNPDYDKVYTDIISKYLPQATVLQYKNIFGENKTASALGIYAGATIIHENHYPGQMVVRDNGATINSILCLNISKHNLATVQLTQL